MDPIAGLSLPGLFPIEWENNAGKGGTIIWTRPSIRINGVNKNNGSCFWDIN